MAESYSVYVKTLALDDVVKCDNHIQLLKFDIEGNEPQVKGCVYIWQRIYPPYIYIKYIYPPYIYF